MTKKETGVKEHKLRREISGVALIFIAILIAFILLNNADSGVVGSFLYRFVASVFGINGSWLLVAFIIGSGLVYIFNRSERSIQLYQAFSIILLFVTLLAIIHLFSVDRSLIVEGIKYGVDGGGLIGALFAYGLQRALGYTGMIITLVGLLLIALLVITRFSIAQSIALVRQNIQNKRTAQNQETAKVQKETGKKKRTPATSDLVIEDSIFANPNSSRPEELSGGQASQATIIATEQAIESDEVSGMDLGEEDGELEVQLAIPDIDYEKPDIELLQDVIKEEANNQQHIRSQAQKIEETLKNFKIDSRVTKVSVGPTITRYEIQIAAGIKVSRVASLENDIALSLAVSHIRIEAPIPGKAAIGIEVPNEYNHIVHLKEVLTSDVYLEAKPKGDVVVALGLDISGQPIVLDICRMPHVMVAGATGSGKSVCINSITCSILFNYTPSEVKFVMIDPKRVELSAYNDIPHLLTPVVTDSRKASAALLWVVQEMEKRYDILASCGARDINSYNNMVLSNKVPKRVVKAQSLPVIIVIIDELADLMMVASKDVEDAICRIAQMGRAAGMHLIVGTQRPSVDVITGLIKANIPTRIAFAVASAVDSRTILDMSGAEKLLGKGDMLYSAQNMSKPIRVQGAFISEGDVARVVKFITNQMDATYEKEDFTVPVKGSAEAAALETDELFNEAVKLVVSSDSASISMIQRRFRVGYSRAARIIDQMELMGVVSGYDGSKARNVYHDSDVVQEIMKEEQ